MSNITNLQEFLKAVQPMCDYSTKIAAYATGLTEATCSKYLNQAVAEGLYTKEWIKGHGNNKGVHRSEQFIGRWHYKKRDATQHSIPTNP